MTTQLGLFGDCYAVKPTCEDCGRIGVRNGLDGPLCADCFDAAGLVVCPNCEETVERTDCAETPDGELWCEECVDAETVECAACNDRVWNNDAVEVVRRRGRRGCDHLCESCANDDTTVCDDCGDRCYHDDSHTTTSDYDICDWCYENRYRTCGDCGRAVHHDDCVTTNYSFYCPDCRPEGNFGPAGFRNHSGRITEIGSPRCFGVELETATCDGYTELEGDPAWGAKDDATISGKEFYSDILSGDEGLDAVRAWARLADKNGWSAGLDAGYHLHMDMRDMDDDQLYAIAYAYRACQEVWLAFVPERRSNGAYSHACRWSLRDVTESADEERCFYSWAGRGTRYNWVNCAAYTRHGTFEIRAHHGTCDGDEVCNWIKAHTRFADWASSKGLAGVQEALGNLSDAEKFDLIAREAWQDDELRDYYAEKADYYNGIRF